MKNILIFSALAGIAAAVAIYFVSESAKNVDDYDYGYITDEEMEAYDMMENTGRPVTV